MVKLHTEEEARAKKSLYLCAHHGECKEKTGGQKSETLRKTSYSSTACFANEVLVLDLSI